MSVVHVVDGSCYLFAKFAGLKDPYLAAVKAVIEITSVISTSGHLLVAKDCSRSRLKRREWFAGYKANRDGRSDIDGDQLSEAFEEFYSILDELGIQSLTIDGWEADDILASAGAKYDRVRLYSVDKDIQQLISPSTRLFSPRTGRVRRADALARWGINSIAKIVDVQCLMGDRDDGVPGVPGIGPKKAAELVRTYGSARRAWEHRADLSEKVCRAMDAFDLDLGYRLVRLNTELALPDSRDLLWRRSDVPPMLESIFLS